MINNEVLCSRIVVNVVDLADRLERYTVDTSEVDEELMAVFILQMQMDIDALNEAVECGDLAKVSAHAHSIKGMGGTAAMPELSVLAEDLEKAAGAGNSVRVSFLKNTLNECFALVKSWR
ncbi:MAG: Hpt domain-containing protein [Kiritimatiellae bacterium]|nr:Hpt domain-containing protein [Kiritimatiellia bacterium]